MFQIVGEQPILAGSKSKYIQMAFNGNCYFLTTAFEPKIVVFDSCFKQCDCIKTNRIYMAICYDKFENCFWASSDQPSTIYKLSCNFQEIDKLVIKEAKGLISGISYCCDSNKLLVSTPNCLFFADKPCGECAVSVIKLSCGYCTGVTSIAPYYIFNTMSNSKQLINIASQDGTLLFSFGTPENYIVNSILILPNSDNCNLCFQFLATKHEQYPYLINATIDRTCLPELCKCNLEFEEKDCYCGESENGCNACDSQTCNNPCDCENQNPCECSCQRPTDPCCCKRNICDAIESIALVEASIAHILNAEGEKLQKIIASTSDPIKLIKANDSVTKLIINATHLEQILFAKLSVLMECGHKDCCECEICESNFDVKEFEKEINQALNDKMNIK